MPGKVELANYDDVLTYHAPSDIDLVSLQAVRDDVKHLVHTILTRVPDCADRQAAIRKIREGMMTANAAIVLHGKI